MKIKIKRDNKFVEYEVSSNLMLLNALFEIREKIDSTLEFESGCRSMVCGACAVRVDGKEVLACGVKAVDGMSIEPLNYHEVIKDLRVNKSAKLDIIKKEQAYINQYKEVCLNEQDENLTATQSDCILCNSCYSACPVNAVNKEFLGPFGLSRAYRYSVDKRVQNPKTIIDAIQTNGIWDCTLCGECSLVCPKGIDSKADIIKLRNLSSQYGYMDPNFANMSFDFGGF